PAGETGDQPLELRTVEAALAIDEDVTRSRWSLPHDRVEDRDVPGPAREAVAPGIRSTVGGAQLHGGANSTGGTPGYEGSGNGHWRRPASSVGPQIRVRRMRVDA